MYYITPHLDDQLVISRQIELQINYLDTVRCWARDVPSLVLQDHLAHYVLLRQHHSVNALSTFHPQSIQTLLLPFMELFLPLLRDILTTVPSEPHLMAFLPSRIRSTHTTSLLLGIAEAPALQLRLVRERVAGGEVLEVVLIQSELDVWLQPHLLPTPGRRGWIVPEALFEEYFNLPRFNRKQSLRACVAESYPLHGGTVLNIQIDCVLAGPWQKSELMAFLITL